MFKTLNPALLHRLLDGEEDILTSRAEKRRFAATVSPCPRCAGQMEEVLNRLVFTSSEPLPRTLSQCTNCGYSYDPQNGIVVSTGDPTKTVEDPFKITPSED